MRVRGEKYVEEPLFQGTLSHSEGYWYILTSHVIHDRKEKDVMKSSSSSSSIFCQFSLFKGLDV
jgi:hypothetical protein